MAHCFSCGASTRTLEQLLAAIGRMDPVSYTHLKRIASEITALQSEIEGVRRKVFDEVFGFIDERNACL